MLMKTPTSPSIDGVARSRLGHHRRVPGTYTTDADASLSLREAALLMKASYTTIRELVRSGILDAYPLRPGSRHLRVTRRAINEARSRLRALYIDPSSSYSEAARSPVSTTGGDDFLKSLFG